MKNEIPAENPPEGLKLRDLTKDYAKLRIIQGYLCNIYDILLKVKDIEMLSIDA